MDRPPCPFPLPTSLTSSVVSRFENGNFLIFLATRRKALQLLDHIARTTPQRIPSKKLLPLVIKAAFDGPSEVREAALLLLAKLAADNDTLNLLSSVRSVLP